MKGQTRLEPGAMAPQPFDIIRGLGSAERPLLATCITLFDSSELENQLQQRSSRLLGSLAQWGRDLSQGELFRRLAPSADELHSLAEKIQPQIQDWCHGGLSDKTLRLMLWIKLLDALDILPRISVSGRGLDDVSQTMAAQAIQIANPASLITKLKDNPQVQAILERLGRGGNDQPLVTLAQLINAQIEFLLRNAVKEGPLPQRAEEAMIERARETLSGLSPDDQRRLLDEIGAEQFTDTAIRKVLMSGGSLAAVNIGVGMAGFSAYIAAAQVSAFIPLVSGPGLVSLLAVVSNPLTLVGGTAAMVYWATKSARKRIREKVALQVIALLALRGGDEPDDLATQSMIEAFEKAPHLNPEFGLSQQRIKQYQQAWQAVEPALLDRPRIKKSWLEAMRTKGSALLKRHGHLRFTQDDKIIAALTLGDVLYSAAAIDPRVLEAADFSHAPDLDDPIGFGRFAHEVLSLSPWSEAGATHHLQGYVAEQLVACQLVSQGHVVEIPASAHQAGWDFMVDGEKFQVKCLASVSGIEEHFSRYDYPVIANAELMGDLPASVADRVYFVEGYSQELVEILTEASLCSGAEMLSPDIPFFAVSVSAVRQLHRLYNGEISAGQAMAHVATEGAARAGLAAVGGFAGKGIGLVLLGPAGALVMGTALPVLAQAQAPKVIEVLTHGYTPWLQQLSTASNRLHTRLVSGLKQKQSLLQSKFEGVNASDALRYAQYRQVDELIFIREQLIRLEQWQHSRQEPVEKARAIIPLCNTSRLHPVHYQTELNSLVAVINNRPSILHRVRIPVYGKWEDDLKRWFGGRG